MGKKEPIVLPMNKGMRVAGGPLGANKIYIDENLLLIFHFLSPFYHVTKFLSYYIKILHEKRKREKFEKIKL